MSSLKIFLFKKLLPQKLHFKFFFPFKKLLSQKLHFNIFSSLKNCSLEKCISKFSIGNKLKILVDLKSSEHVNHGLKH